MKIKFQDITSCYRYTYESRGQQTSPIEITNILSQVHNAREGESHGDIVKFYNCVFIPRLKNHIWALADPQQLAGTTLASPSIGGAALSPSRSPLHAGAAPGSVPMPLAQSPQRIAPNVSLYLSPRAAPRASPGQGHIHSMIVGGSGASGGAHSAVNIHSNSLTVPQMSPFRLRMTPRTKALYAFGENFAEKLNTAPAATIMQPHKQTKRALHFDTDLSMISPKRVRRMSSQLG